MALCCYFDFESHSSTAIPCLAHRLLDREWENMGTLIFGIQRPSSGTASNARPRTVDVFFGEILIFVVFVIAAAAVCGCGCC